MPRRPTSISLFSAVAAWSDSVSIISVERRGLGGEGTHRLSRYVSYAAGSRYTLNRHLRCHAHLPQNKIPFGVVPSLRRRHHSQHIPTDTVCVFRWRSG